MSVIIGIVLLLQIQRKPVLLFQNEIADYSFFYVLLMYVNMNLASSFSVTNLLTYNQHLLEPFLNEYISMEKWSILQKSLSGLFKLIYGCSMILSCIMLGRIYINQLSNHSLDFMGYRSSVRLKRSMVRNQMLENAFLIDNAIKKFDTIVPIMPLIGSLAKSKFCNALGAFYQ
ncbi:hypothetical protein Ccrd_010455 [Cynara cardunculus var. scolymus]|uniref:Maturase K n=1 Tax=Cynara cardunculus var. scolymus TaxID=59895 RepID=A0A103YL44_CYNCS|nr:hypothetical protein Ccrd_010455 [Cynara cardunculus var. scolymus]